MTHSISTKKLSIIIPTYNEAASIQALIHSILSQKNEFIHQIIIADSPASTDGTLEAAQAIPGVLAVKSPQRGRSAQMNYGASFATGDIFYFVHADTRLHPDFCMDIQAAIREGFHLGCYRYLFDTYPTPLLRINSFFTRFNKIWCRGGDQTLFITKEAFLALGGFQADYLIMEDYDILLRAQEAKMAFKIIPKNVVVSARKYSTNGYFKVQFANFTVMRMFLKGKHTQQEMAETYKKMLDYRN
ncbi:MAG: TIGR04283 family arsenosugar biosynthesis glycosyltransferase [Spirosomataceae bacterium]